MGIEYYAFALFVAGLICVIAIICKVLFANVKRQQKLLDERESQILKLYTSVETLMEEFSDQVKATMEEIKEYEYRSTSHITAFDLPPELEKKEQVQLLEKLPRTLPLDASRIRVAGEVLERAERIIKNEVITNHVTASSNNHATPQAKEENGAIFQKFFDESVEAAPPANGAEASATQTRTDAIRALSGEGKSDVEIARQLGITRNEVMLVVGLTR